MDPLVKLAAASSWLTDAKRSDSSGGRAPYLAGILEMLVRTESRDPRLTTLAVSADARLYYCPEFVEKTEVPILALALYHEALHVLWDHLHRAKGMHPRASNVCQDACINETIREFAKLHKIEAPADWVYSEGLQQPAGLIFEERYKLLKEAAEKEHGKGAGCGQGQCGSGAAGQRTPGEPAPADDGKGRSKAEMDRARKTVAEAAKAYAEKNRGTLPSGMAIWVQQTLQPPKVDWREELLNTVRVAAAARSGFVDQTYTRPSRRQGGLGYTSRSPILPGWHAPIPEVAVVVDTSGSMGADFDSVFAELEGILQTLSATVSVVAVDSEAYGVKPVASLQDLKLQGGGGTDMRPGFVALEAANPRPSLVIVLTDGYIGDGYPAAEPSWCDTIWVTVGKGQYEDAPCPWGKWIAAKD